MKVAVLTDTHVGSVHELPKTMLAALSEADLIVHAGDFTEIGVLEGLRSLNESGQSAATWTRSGSG